MNTVSDVRVLQNAGNLLTEGFSGSTCSMAVFTGFLTTLLVTQGISIEWRDDKLVLDWKERRRKRSWLNIRHCPGV
jgi:hypothetical protein